MSTRLTADDHRLRAVTEAQWQATVLQIAHLNGWRWYHPPRAGIRRNGSVRETVPGFPDLVLVRGPRLLFVELKRQTGKVSDNQQQWLVDLARASAEVYVWRPADLLEVTAVLGRRPVGGVA